MKGTREDLKMYRVKEKELIAELEHVQEIIVSLEHTAGLEMPKKARKPRTKKEEAMDEAPEEQEEEGEGVFA